MIKPCYDRRLTNLVYRLSLAFVIVAVLIRVVSPAPALACTPPPPPPDGVYPPYTLADRVNGAEVVLEGTITAVEGDWLETVTVAVQQYLKGRGPASVTIDNFGPGSLCLTRVTVGQHGIFYATGQPETGLRAYYYVPPHRPQLSPVSAPDPQTMAEITAVVGQPPFIPKREAEPAITPLTPPTVIAPTSSAVTQAPSAPPTGIADLAAGPTFTPTATVVPLVLPEAEEKGLNIIGLIGGGLLLIVIFVGITVLWRKRYL